MLVVTRLPLDSRQHAPAAVLHGQVPAAGMCSGTDAGSVRPVSQLRLETRLNSDVLAVITVIPPAPARRLPCES
jgi:hypothetical protein